MHENSIDSDMAAHAADRQEKAFGKTFANNAPKLKVFLLKESLQRENALLQVVVTSARHNKAKRMNYRSRMCMWDLGE